jgi:hypothetical protein
VIHHWQNESDQLINVTQSRLDIGCYIWKAHAA